MFVCVFVLESREKGMAWGICVGIIGGYIALSVFQKHKIIPIAFATIIYSLVVFSFMYGITNYMKPLFLTVKFILYALSIIISWEISQYLVRKIMSAKETKTEA
jgi:CHASE2 domain-containing sensor protein